MMRWFFIGVVVLVLAGCGQRRQISEYDPRTDKDAMRAWSAAYNRDQLDQLALLIHPQKRADFYANRRDMKVRLENWLVRGFQPGAPVRVNEELKGRTVVFQMIDNRGLVESREGIVVETRGRWWLWRY